MFGILRKQHKLGPVSLTSSRCSFISNQIPKVWDVYSPCS